MTVAEYARMINGEGWLKDGQTCRLSWIPCKNYTHAAVFDPPKSPSPNLPNLQAIRLYPSLAFFEGTVVSEGRGTDFPFQVFGFPGYQAGDFIFKPESRIGASVHPKFENQECRGMDLRSYSSVNGQWNSLNLQWLIDAYNDYEDKTKFFLPYFDKLAGTDQLRKDIQDGLTQEEIKGRWKAGLAQFMSVRKKYVLYD
jgi:uncharacterized protein YbbC (DUF1343 family)